MFTPLKDTTLTIPTASVATFRRLRRPAESDPTKAGSQLRPGEAPLVPGSKKLNGTS
jgi:hypothetical protein